MLFNSYVFVLFFLPVFIIGYFSLNHYGHNRLAQLFLLGMSLWFYGYFHIKYLSIMAASILANYLVYKRLSSTEKKRRRKLLLAGAVSFNLGILFFFKYYNFFMSNVNQLCGTAIPMLNVMLPLGISFFTFQQLSFVIDAYEKKVPNYGFLNYASFVTFFPQLIAGPIVTHDELIPQFMDKRKKAFDWENFSKGIYIFAMGMGKKVLVADTLGNAVNWGFGNIAALDSTNALMVMLSYTLQIYFDFSGYCDMAIGISKMVNIDLPLNFNSPYKALTINAFWKRWHITLTRFFTTYIYLPLGGNRKGKLRTYIHVMIVFLVSGLWHGANWTFIFWGACHGIFSVITRHWKGFFSRLHPAVSWLLTFSFVNVTWVFFRADRMADGIQLIGQIAKLDFAGINPHIVECFYLPEVRLLSRYIFTGMDQYMPAFVAVFLLILLFCTLRLPNAYEKMLGFVPTVSRAILTAVLLVWCICSFSGISTFLYFNF